MDVLWHPEAEAERGALLQGDELKAVRNAVAKLEALGVALPYPHCSSVRGVDADLWELRPRQGRSRWRALYRRIGDVMVIGAVCPEAQVDSRAFARGVAAALARLAAVEPEESQ